MSSFVLVRSCVLPQGLHYKIEEHLWLRPEADGSVTLGFTDMAQTTAGRMLVVSFRPIGARYKQGKTIAIVESAKWLGPLRAPMDGTLVAGNESLFEDAGLVNRSPYNKGWIVRYKPMQRRHTKVSWNAETWTIASTAKGMSSPMIEILRRRDSAGG